MGTFTTVLIHCLAHIKVGEMGNDTTPQFVKTLYAMVSKCCRELYFNRSTTLHESELHLLDVQEIFNIKLTGIQGQLEHQIAARVDMYKEMGENLATKQSLDSESSERGNFVYLSTVIQVYLSFLSLFIPSHYCFSSLTPLLSSIYLSTLSFSLFSSPL